MSVKTYPITAEELGELVDAIALLDWIKNVLPDASPEKREAVVKAARSHAVIGSVLGSDQHLVYAPEEEPRI